MTDTSKRNFDDWLAEFVDYAAATGEAPLHVLYWVGVATIAGALRRRVWIDEVTFQWVPNFYIVVVAEPGIIAKSTTANVGFNLLRKVDGIHFGPDIVTWERLMAKMGEIGEFTEIGEEKVPMNAMTCAIDELGTFFDPENREQNDALVALWDGQNRKLTKETKTQGNDEILRPWLNWFACTTPAWTEQTFPDHFLGGGLSSRMIFLRARDKRTRIAYPSRRVKSRAERGVQQAKLIADLQQIAQLGGAFQLSEEAFQYGEKLYNEHWDKFTVGSFDLQGYPARWQSHLHKLAMVISASRGTFPAITMEHLKEASERLKEVEPGIAEIFSRIGGSGLTRAGSDIIAVLRENGGAMKRRELFTKHFFRRMPLRDFTEAVNSAVATGQVVSSQDLTTLSLVKGKV